MSTETLAEHDFGAASNRQRVHIEVFSAPGKIATLRLWQDGVYVSVDGKVVAKDIAGERYVFKPGFLPRVAPSDCISHPVGTREAREAAGSLTSALKRFHKGTWVEGPAYAWVYWFALDVWDWTG